MNSLEIKRQNGNVPKSLPGQDHVSGMIFYVNEADIPEDFKAEAVQAVSTIDAAEALGITSDATSWAARVMHYQLSEVFRINNGITLYVGIFTKPAAHTFAELATVQNYADGAIRQFGIWDGLTELTKENATLLQSQADALDLNNAPVSVGYAPSLKGGYQALPTDIAGAAPRVSVIIAQPGGTNDTGALLFAEATNKTTKNAVSCIGVWLGHVSAAAVHESISWVKKFPSGISLPAFSDGTLVRSVDKAWLEKLDTARYLFLTPIVGVSGSYWNDSHNMDAAISDYNAIELVRTMDKACRGIRTYLTPELGGNVYIDANTGKLQSYTVAYLETVANKALEDMEKAGELSGYEAKIDPEQDVLSTSTVEVVIKNVPVGVIRKMKVKIGYVKSL
jgi:hypothetical protein|nr:MAG TPA: tail sheath protein [Caudoviricetes sp.]